MRRFKGLIFLNILGLALGLASVICIAVWITYKMSYDRFFRNSDRIYRIESLFNYSGERSVWSITPSPLAESVRNEFPEVEDAVRLASGRRDVLKAGENLFFAENLYYTDHSFFNVFSPEVISGDLTGLLKEPEEIVLSKYAANVLFGSSDPVGKQVLLNNSDLLTVKGIMNDFPSNTHLRIDYLVSFSILKKPGEDLDSWGRFDFLTYVLLKKNADAEKFNNKMSEYLQTKIKNLPASLFVNPLTRIYLYRDPGFKSFKYPGSDRGPVTRVKIFALIGSVLLLIACINFVNLSTAFASHRAKEIGIRKVNGADRINLIIHLFGESLIQTFMATIAALVIVILMLPLFIKVTGANLGISDLFSLKNLAVYIILMFVTGFIAGLYPALVLASFNPARVMKPMPEDTTLGSGLRRLLVVIQFSLSLVFIFCIMVMSRQVSYMQTLDLGFNKEGVMVVSPRAAPEKIDAMAEEIEKIPGVRKVALGGNVPVNMGNFNTFNKWDGNAEGKPLMFYMVQVDDRYMDLLGIKLIDGKNLNTYSYGTEVIVNETAARKMGMENPVGKAIWWGDTRYTITGVVRDYHFHGLKDEIRPVFIYKARDWWIKRIFVSLEPGNHLKIVDQITATVRKATPGFPVSYMFLEDEVNKYYEEERRLNILINAATILSIFISCLGLFSLTAFTIRKKYREIGIRKAYGATSAGILFMLQKDFSLLIIVASVIALPAGYYFVEQWLKSYAYHIALNPVFFIVPVLIILLIASGTIISNSLRASGLNPAFALKNE